MNPFNFIIRRVRRLFGREKLDAEMAEEMRVHLELQTRENHRRGMSCDEAHYAARREFGGVEQIKEVVREQRGRLWLEQAWQDLRYALRHMRQSPAFVAVVILSLALGIGANTAIFSLVDEVLLKMLPVKNPQELVLFHWSAAQGWVGPVSGSWETDPVTKKQTCTSFSARAFGLFRDNHPTLSAVFAFAPLGELTVSVDGQAEASSLGGQFVSGGYYEGLGVPAILGRMIANEDDQPGAAPVAVLSYRYWQQRFGGEPGVIGKTISINNAPVTIIGVTPRAFLGALDVGNAPDVSVPIALLPLMDPDTAALTNRPGGMWWLRVMGRVKPGTTPEQVRASLEGIFHQSAIDDAGALPSRGPAAANHAPEIPLLGVEQGGQGLMHGRQAYTQVLMALMGLVGLVLLIACANVASLLLARGAARRREIAARLALGASRGRLVRQLLTETGLLVFLGGAAGMLLAHWGTTVLVAMKPLESGAPQPLVLNAALDWRVLGFTTAATMICGVLVGLVPALRATRIDLNQEFQGGMRNHGGGRSRLGQALLIVQVALSLVLLVGAGLFVRTLRNLEGVDVGFNRSRLLLFGINAKPPVYDHVQAAALHERIQLAVGAIPGVQAATFSRMPLLSNSGWNTRISIPGRPSRTPGRGDVVMLNAVAPEFFSTLEIPILYGRAFTGRDDARANKVVLINEAMVRQYFAAENPVGQHFNRRTPSGETDLEIVGVVRDAKYAAVKNQAPATIYVPFLQETSGEASYAVRTHGDPVAVVASIRAAIRAIDPNLPLVDVRTQDEQMEKLFANERLFARFSSFFGLLALALVCVGLYGLMSYAVTRRTGEIGVRMALGASPRGVLWLVLRESLLLIGIGTLVGFAAAAAITRFVGNLLFGVTPVDAPTYGGVALILMLVALLAAWRPARRAASIDPMVTLRCE